MDVVHDGNVINHVIDDERGMIKYHYDGDSVVIESAKINPGYTLVLGSVIGFIDTVMLTNFIKENVTRG